MAAHIYGIYNAKHYSDSRGEFYAFDKLTDTQSNNEQIDARQVLLRHNVINMMDMMENIYLPGKYGVVPIGEADYYMVASVYELDNLTFAEKRDLDISQYSDSFGIITDMEFAKNHGWT